MFRLTCFNCLEFRERILNKATKQKQSHRISKFSSLSSLLCNQTISLGPFMLHWSSFKRHHEIKRCLLLGRKAMTNLDSILKSRDITLLTKIHLVKAVVFPVVMYGCESWTVKKAERQRIDAFELWCWRRLKNWLIGKDPDAGKDWRQEEKGMTEDEMVGWYHRLDGHEFEQALGVGDGQRSLACRSPWGHKESDTTEWMNWTELIKFKSDSELSSWPLLSLLEYVERVWLLPLSFNYWTMWLVDKLRDKFPMVLLWSYLDSSPLQLCSGESNFPGGLDGKESACNAGDPGSKPGSGRSPGEGNSYPFQYSCLENPMGRGVRWAIVHGVAKSQTWLSN